jgi:translation initiation factor RLI1
MNLNEIPMPFSLITTQQFQQGQRIVLVGDNGIGKSLFVQSLKQEVFKQQLPSWSFVDQNRIHAFDMATVYSYLSLLTMISADSFISQDFEHWLGFKEGKVEQYLNHSLETLSGGEMQWLKLMIGLNLKAHNYVLDEPTQFLDIHKKQIFWDLFQQKLQNQDRMLMVLHQDFPPFQYQIWKMEVGESSQQRLLRAEAS